MTDIEFYKSLSLQKIAIDDVAIGLRQVGEGDHLVFIHGFPTHGYTWRKLIPQLSQHYQCHILDLPGLGDSQWSDTTDFSSKSQARYVMKLLEKLGIEKCSLVAHDSGATIARYIAIEQPDQIENLFIFNTEIPDHRPPWIPFYQKVGLWPGGPNIIRWLLSQQWFIKSPMGFKELYTDESWLEDPSNLATYTDPVIHSQEKAIGALKYLKGIDWELVDAFKTLHKVIKAKTLILWGEDDNTFPVALGKQMIHQFDGNADFVTIKDASLLPHEEQPEAVAEEILKFVGKR